MVGGFTKIVHNPRHGFAKVHTIQAMDSQKVNNLGFRFEKYMHNPRHEFAKGVHNLVEFEKV